MGETNAVGRGPARAHDDERTRRLPWRRAGLIAVAAATLVVAGCTSGGTDEVVSAGPVGTGNPESPAADNPTSSSVVGAVSTTAAEGSSTTTDPDAAASTSTTPTSVPPASTTPDTLADASLTMQVFWVRAPGEDRRIDIPGYRDPESGPKPLVVYGSATNTTSSSVAVPKAVVLWKSASGETRHLVVTDVLLPGTTTPAPALAPGESGDVIVVIEGALATELGDLAPELQGGSGSQITQDASPPPR